MKIIIDRNTPDSRQSAVVEIDTKHCHYPYAIRESIELALKLDGYDERTIDDVFCRERADVEQEKGCVDCIEPGPDIDYTNWLKETPIKQPDFDIRDNQIMLLKEDLEVAHMYLDKVEVKRKDDNGETYSIVGRIKQYQRDALERLSNLESAVIKEQNMMYSEEEVEKILESQRGNCYVSVFNKTKDDDIAILTITSPEPGDWKKSERI